LLASRKVSADGSSVQKQEIQTTSPVKQLPLIIALFAIAGCAPTLHKQTTHAHPDTKALQKIVEEQVKSGRESLRPKAMVVVVAEPKTGKILAISGYEKGSGRARAILTSFVPRETRTRSLV
jgi:membrane carboxypeptidase/penicillin-binding protein PbpC